MLTVQEYSEILRMTFMKNVERQTSWGREQLKIMFMETLIEANNIMLKEWFRRAGGGEKQE
jgi:hypothetical protein